MINIISSHTMELWIDKYAPKSISDLAIHKKKIEEVMNWITKHSNSSQSSSVLLITGPSGCGKTATLCAMSTIEISTWQDDSDEDAVNGFTEFLFKSSRYLDLNDNYSENKENNNKKKLILIESFPNEFYNEPSKLHELLIRYKSIGKCPLVIIISDSQTMRYSQHWLLPKSIQTQLNIETITFNPIAFTFMKKSIQAIIKKESKHMSEKQQQDIIKNVSQMSDGDIRSAINNLQMLLTVKERSSTESQIQMNKDSHLFLFRGLGKILYCKRETDEVVVEKSRAEFNKCLPHCSRMFRAPLMFSPEEVYDSCGIDYLTFVSYLHENHLDFIEDIDQVTQICDDLSLSESLFNRWLPESNDVFGRYLVSVSTRSMMFYNESRPKSSFRALRKSGLPDLWKKVLRLHSSIVDCSSDAVAQGMFDLRAVMNPTSLLCDTLPCLSRLAFRRPDLTRKLTCLGILDNLRFSKKSTRGDLQAALEDNGVPEPDEAEPVPRKASKEQNNWTVCRFANEDNVVITTDD